MDLSHLRETLARGRWSVTYSPDFVKQVSKAKTKRTPSTATSTLELPGEPPGGNDPVLSHLLRLGEQRGWHHKDGIGINVAYGAKSFRTPEPRFSAKEFPRRTTYGRFDTGGDQAVWRVLERDFEYQSAPNQHALIGVQAQVLVTFFCQPAALDSSLSSTLSPTKTPK
jgi:hypothetical protein